MKAATADHLTLGEIVSKDYRAAAIFERHGLDYCCGGKRSVAEACRAKALDSGAVLADLEALEPDSAAPAAPDYESWDAERLVDHILTRHHSFVRAALPRITTLLEQLEQVHGARHPELMTVANHFRDVRQELEQHLLKEEEVLFPYVRTLAQAYRGETSPPPNIFGTVRNPIRMMEIEHQSAGGELVLIRELTGGYRVPPDGCATYQVAMEELVAFERDLFLHIHLENNILFGKAIALEAQLASSHPGTLPSERWGDQ